MLCNIIFVSSSKQRIRHSPSNVQLMLYTPPARLIAMSNCDKLSFRSVIVCRSGKHSIDPKLQKTSSNRCVVHPGYRLKYLSKSHTSIDHPAASNCCTLDDSPGHTRIKVPTVRQFNHASKLCEKSLVGGDLRARFINTVSNLP